MFDSILKPDRSGSKAAYRDPDLQAFSEFIAFFRAEFARPGFLDGVACRETIREYVPKYYGKTFGARVNGPIAIRKSAGYAASRRIDATRSPRPAWALA